MPRQTVRGLRQAHLAVGIAGLAAVPLTGQYMHWFLAHLHNLPDGPRLMYRTSHIYLFWSAAINLLLGVHLRIAKTTSAIRLQAAGSWLILPGPILLWLSFFLESNQGTLSRPWAKTAVLLALAGVACHGVSAWLDRVETASPPVMND